jgi:hypothetical protein
MEWSRKISAGVQVDVRSACYLDAMPVQVGGIGVRCLVGAGLLSVCLGAEPALADARCNVPLADWQPREALQKKLAGDGWTVLSIRSDDGCYKVKATNPSGGRLEGKFDPGSLEPIQSKDDDDGDD